MPKSLNDYADEAKETVREILPEEAGPMADTGWVLLDVREEDEYDEGHIPGAMLIPRGVLEVRADLDHHKRDQRLQDRNQRFICYCGGGIRSLLAAKVLKEMGFADAVSLCEGWRGWQERGLPEEC
ncbi:MAG: rhodanese-like domain-containing protein [Fimbriimonadales bacterium]